MPAMVVSGMKFPDRIQPVPEVPPTRMPDHPDPKRFVVFASENERGARQGDGLEKEPSSVSHQSSA